MQQEYPADEQEFERNNQENTTRAPRRADGGPTAGLPALAEIATRDSRVTPAALVPPVRPAGESRAVNISKRRMTVAVGRSTLSTLTGRTIPANKHTGPSNPLKETRRSDSTAPCFVFRSVRREDYFLPVARSQVALKAWPFFGLLTAVPNCGL